MDLGLAAELGLHRQHGQALGLLTAVAAALADPLVDRHPPGGVGQVALLAQPPLLGRALLVVDEHRHAGDRGQLALGVLQRRPVAHLGDARQPDTPVAPGLVGGDDDPAHPLGLQPAGQVGHRQGRGDRLPARHRDRAVVEQLVGDVDARADRGPDRERAAVVEGAVAQVLEDVRGVGERRLADPLRALAAHLGQAGERALALAVEHHHGVAADPGADGCAVGDGGGTVVRAARAEEGGAPGGEQRQRRRARDDGEPLRHLLAEVGQAPAAQPEGDGLGGQVGVDGAVPGDEPRAVLVELAQHAGGVGGPVQDVLDRGLQQRGLLLHDEDLRQPPGEGPDDLRVQRPEHADLQEADAGLLRRDAELAEALADVVVGGS